MQIYWVQDHQIEPVVATDERGILINGRGIITWEEARRLHAQDPETGLIYVTFDGQALRPPVGVTSHA